MFTILRALPLLWQIGIGVAILAAAGGAYWGWHHHVYQQGYSAAIADVAAADAAAVARVTIGQQDITTCRAKGGTWDVVTGSCSQ